ncbi:MAG: hypothetical protein ACFFB5_02665 [Promethearchaeota archaeon]
MNIFYIIILIVVIIFTYRTINSYSQGQIKKSDYDFKKAKTRYIDPPRPNSNSYNELIRLISSNYSRRHKQVILMLSQLIRDYMKLTGEEDKIKCSENLILLIKDPNGWYRHYSDEMALKTHSGTLYSRIFRKKDSSEIFYQKLLIIIEEVQQVLGIPLISIME